MGRQNLGLGKALGKTRTQLTKDPRSLRKDLTPEQYIEALRIGRIQFKSAGAKRQSNV